MSVAQDIAATYRGPGRVMRRLLEMGQREDRALVILMVACTMFFVAGLPGQAREAHLSGEDLDMMMGGALLGWLIIAPLCFYLLAGLSHVVARALGGQGGWYGARLALFWALLAASPVLLLHGLVSGFIGQGPVRDGVGLLWLAVFLWFWLTGLRQAERRGG